jgi:hypothetical protein
VIRASAARTIARSASIPTCSLPDGSPCYPEGWQRVLDGVQNVLGLAGFVPALGAVPDLLKATISAERGDGPGAVLSLAAALPAAGDAFAAASSFRGAMQRGTFNSGIGQHAHHIFSQKFTDTRKKLDINWNGAENGAWWEVTDHLRNAYGYNKEWQ